MIGLDDAQDEPLHSFSHHDKPGDDVLVGFADEDEWFDYRLEHDPRFLKRIAEARQSFAAGRGTRLEDVQP